jgi:hypothetical protein
LDDATSCDNQPSECEQIISALRDIERKNGLDYPLRVGALVLELSFRGQTKLVAAPEKVSLSSSDWRVCESFEDGGGKHGRQQGVRRVADAGLAFVS